jgi:hypothetical protein
MSGEGVAVAGDDGCTCKIGRNAEAYAVEDLDRRLLERRAEGASLRRLETVVNRAILRAALREADAAVIGDAASVYETLTGDDVSAGRRTETKERLSRAGVDPDELLDDFVSYGTVRSHLRDCLDVDTDRRSTLSVEDAQGTIEWARSRSEGIVERTVERLAGTEGFSAGDVEVGHVVRVSCRDCGASHPVESFLDRGGCDCDPDE